MSKRLLAVLGLLFSSTLAFGEEKLPLPVLDPAVREQLVAFVAGSQTPEEYVLSKFRDHDVVFLGEYHRIRHDVRLVRDLVPLLYARGIRTLCTEFARREDQRLINRLITARTYDEELAREVTLRSAPYWGYQEYLDIYRAAWTLNRSLRRGLPKFRILALGDSPDWRVIKTPEDMDNDELRKKVWRGGGEHVWAQVILEEVVAKGEKALVYCGIHHAFTEFQQPVVIRGKLLKLEDSRVGNYVHRSIGKRAFTIFLHAPWRGSAGYDTKPIYPVDGVIDAIIAALPADQRRRGFDTRGTPVGALSARDAVYRNGYENFTLATFCDGYIIQKPLSEYEGVTTIPDFLDAETMRRAAQWIPNPRSRSKTPEELTTAMREDANMQRRFSALH